MRTWIRWRYRKEFRCKLEKKKQQIKSPSCTGKCIRTQTIVLSAMINDYIVIVPNFTLGVQLVSSEYVPSLYKIHAKETHCEWLCGQLFPAGNKTFVSNLILF